MTTTEFDATTILCPGGCGFDMPIRRDELRACARRNKEPQPCADCLRRRKLMEVQVSRYGQRSKADTILLAMLRLQEEAGDDPVPQTALVLAAWELDRKGFGLKGEHEKHPCSNRAIVSIVNLTNASYMRRAGELQFRLTEKGRRRALVVRNNL